MIPHFECRIPQHPAVQPRAYVSGNTFVVVDVNPESRSGFRLIANTESQSYEAYWFRVDNHVKYQHEAMATYSRAHNYPVDCLVDPKDIPEALIPVCYHGELRDDMNGGWRGDHVDVLEFWFAFRQ